ncbi:MAG: sporulation initiation factor Spo0A C-terminal domain-containing protein [Clostridia bacterium]|nr:sporulation initiation factor Spo0A C-terminal domain-containing protein [Clostridia bacterium]
MLITSNYKGYHYIMTAYELTRKKPELLNCITTKLYPMIAKKHNTSTQSVERAIRTVIALCFEDGMMPFFRGVPTVAQFIGVIWSVGPSRFLLTQESEGKDQVYSRRPFPASCK